MWVLSVTTTNSEGNLEDTTKLAMRSVKGYSSSDKTP